MQIRQQKSRDGKYLIHRTIITDIKPVNYYSKVLDSGDTENFGEGEAEEEAVEEEAQ